MSIKANHICRYSGCTLGKDGKPKEYYACDYCDRINSWRSVACCREHYDSYIREELDRKSRKGILDLLPNRTDKTKEEIRQLYNIPAEEVFNQTKESLKEYINDDMSNLNDAIEQINQEIDNGRR